MKPTGLFKTIYKINELNHSVIETKFGVNYTRRLFNFTSTRSQHRYIIIVEEFPSHFYFVKFCLASHLDSDDKFNLFTKHNEPSAIVRTVIDLMLKYIAKDDCASFGFVGSPSLVDEKSNNFNNSKRFQFYSRIMRNFFSPISFVHIDEMAKSRYIMLNKKQLKNDADLMEKIAPFFED